MAEKVLMLALSPTMETGTIIKWRVKEGDTVENSQILCDVETDKAVMEYESINEGTLLKIVVPEGSEAQVGEVIAVVGEKGEDIKEILEESSAGLVKKEKEYETVSVKPGAGDEKIGTKPEAEDITIQNKSGAEDVSIKNKFVAEGVISETGQEPLPESASDERLLKGVKASPLARKLAEQHHLDISAIQGSGPDGRIVKKDIEAYEKQTAASAQAVTTKRTETASISIPVSGKRKIIAQRLSESKYSAPHYYLKVVASVDELLKSRKLLNSKMENKVSFNAFLIKLTAEALRKHRMVNAGWQDDVITQYGSADIGLAVAQPDGLITPVVKDCWNRGIVDIDSELKVLIDKALNNRLKPEEYSGATFTITNLGSYGIREFTAIINPPGSAILAVGQAVKEPVVGEDDNISIRSNMALTLSCDHRVIDGAVGALFLNELKEMIEDPIMALL
jgi:pyruvate dehydrogenase E2 component (dihydrolipoamide acetyltransferase)